MKLTEQAQQAADEYLTSVKDRDITPRRAFIDGYVEAADGLGHVLLAEEVADAIVARLHTLPSRMKPFIQANRTYWMNLDTITVNPINGLVLIVATDEHGIWLRWTIHGGQTLCEIRMEYAR